MNRVLFKAAAIVNIAAAALIYVACSGDDGKDGPPGPAGAACTVEASATVGGGVDVICGGVRQTLNPGPAGAPGAPGQNGTGVPADGCYLQATGAAGTYTVICGGAPVGSIGGPGGGAGCTIVDNPTNSAYLLITCGTETQDLAKAMCGTTPYDPKKWACDYSGPQPVLAEHRCGTFPYDPDVEFCQNGTTVRPLCGAGKEEYTADQFCQPTNLEATVLTDLVDSIAYASFPDLNRNPSQTTPAGVTNTAATGTIQSRCGAEKKAYAPFQFCFANSTVYQKCATGTTPALVANGGTVGSTTHNKGIEYEADQLCTSGVVSGNCGGLPYVASNEFCQSAGTIKLLCGPNTEPLANRKYTADQFCQIPTIAHTDVNASTAFASPYSAGEAKLDVAAATALNAEIIRVAQLNGKIKSYCVKTGTGAAKLVFNNEKFCQSNNTATANVDNYLCEGATLPSAKEYPATSFCQSGDGDGYLSTETNPATNDLGTGAGIATTSSAALSGKITPKCLVGSGRTFGEDHYCSSATVPVIESKPACRSALPATATTKGHAAIYYDPEIEFCLSATITSSNSDVGVADGKIYPTCATRAAASGGINIFTAAALAGDKYYNPTNKVCETRGNILYGIEELLGSGNGFWITENAKPGNVNTFTWTEARTACPGSDVKLIATTNATGTDDGTVTALEKTKDIYGAYGYAPPSGKGTSATNPALSGQWQTLAAGTSGGGGNAGIELRAKSIWTNQPDNDDFSKFAALPAAVTGISPAPAGNYTYWWTSDEGGYLYDTNGNLTGAGSNLNIGNYVFIEEESTALGQGGSAKLTTKLSVRCVK